MKEKEQNSHAWKSSPICRSLLAHEALRTPPSSSEKENFIFEVLQGLLKTSTIPRNRQAGETEPKKKTGAVAVTQH